MLEKITQILRDYKDDQSLEVSKDTTFESLELDSLDLTQLVMDVEDAFGVTVEMDSPITTVSALMEIIEKANG